jgi:glucosyl-dolichyl phosphate glucuronosyltransferase
MAVTAGATIEDGTMENSVVIATHNRADDLRETLLSLAQLSTTTSWEVIVVDNNSTDHTRAVVEALQPGYPTTLTYLFEQEQGRSAALNAGFRAARGEIILTTDDDVRVEPDWLDQGVAALRRFDCAFVGGKVLPIWGGQRPFWLPETGGRLWVPIAMLDFGPEPVEFATRAPLGVNMALRKDVLERAGYFDNTLGRKAGTLLGQEVREWCMRVRAAGMTGYYIPEMVIHHKVVRSRLTKNYWRRSFYWRGVSRAILYRMTGADLESPEETSPDLSRAPHVAGVPRYLYRKFLRTGLGLLRALARRDTRAVLDQEMQLWFYAGMFVESWKRVPDDPPRVAAPPSQAAL